jgi:hypothetical protein
VYDDNIEDEALGMVTFFVLCEFISVLPCCVFAIPASSPCISLAVMESDSRRAVPATHLYILQHTYVVALCSSLLYLTLYLPQKLAQAELAVRPLLGSSLREILLLEGKVELNSPAAAAQPPLRGLRVSLLLVLLVPFSVFQASHPFLVVSDAGPITDSVSSSRVLSFLGA